MYKPNENCEWTVNAGKVALSFASMDMEMCKDQWCDWVEIRKKDGSWSQKWDEEQNQADSGKTWTLDGPIVISFHSDPGVHGNGFELNIDEAE